MRSRTSPAKLDEPRYHQPPMMISASRTKKPMVEQPIHLRQPHIGPRLCLSRAERCWGSSAAGSIVIS